MQCCCAAGVVLTLVRSAQRSGLRAGAVAAAQLLRPSECCISLQFWDRPLPISGCSSSSIMPARPAARPMCNLLSVLCTPQIGRAMQCEARSCCSSRCAVRANTCSSHDPCDAPSPPHTHTNTFLALHGTICSCQSRVNLAPVSTAGTHHEFGSWCKAARPGRAVREGTCRGQGKGNDISGIIPTAPPTNEAHARAHPAPPNCCSHSHSHRKLLNRRKTSGACMRGRPCQPATATATAAVTQRAPS